ncbi:trace amine-associated receptor 5-like [Saccostrea cucullata]|uniref:trace amine-associated receptor 5-like n=1 Tax=Saccostrea cuccullata TaxID=36930 RepID=UPI002ED265D0
MNRETKQYYNRTIWFAMLSSMDGTHTYKTDFTVSFFLFDPKIIAETSEGFEKSIAILTLIIGLLGFVGNIVTIFKIVCDKRLHTPTFLAIGCLALPDTLNIIGIFVRKFSDLFIYVVIQHDYNESMFEFLTFYFLDQTFISCSTAHIVFLAMIRYLLIVHPLESKVRLTVPIVMSCSVMIWIYSLLLSAFILIIIATITEDSIDRSGKIMYTFSILSILRGWLAICAIIIMHIKKVMALNMSSVTNTICLRMNVIICIILSVYVFSLIPFMLFTCYSLYVVNTDSLLSFSFVIYMYDICLIFGIFNFSCNPYVIFWASHIFL